MFVSFKTYLTLLVLLPSIILNAQAQDSTVPKPQENNSEKPSQWIKRGEPISDFPLCYQLWQCRSEIAEKNKSKDIPVLPVGTWGLCENYLTPQDGTPVCHRCDALLPDVPCF